jgi:hypothetical protein
MESLPPLAWRRRYQHHHQRLGNNNGNAVKSGEFYSSTFVLIVTGIWTFVLSVFVHAPKEPSQKKEL